MLELSGFRGSGPSAFRHLCLEVFDSKGPRDFGFLAFWV